MTAVLAVQEKCTKSSLLCLLCNDRYIPKVQPGAEVGEYCEAGPGKNEVQTYCNAYAVTLHGQAVAKILHAKPV